MPEIATGHQSMSKVTCNHDAWIFQVYRFISQYYVKCSLGCDFNNIQGESGKLRRRAESTSVDCLKPVTDVFLFSVLQVALQSSSGSELLRWNS